MNVTQRFLRYVAFDTQSDDNSDTTPSTDRQKLLGQALAAELRELGLADAAMDDKGYVMATLPANTDRKLPVLGLIAHMDTSPDFSGRDVKPRLVAYEGGDLVLNGEKGIVLRAADFPKLSRSVGKHLLVTDGSTLLGADDKAGMAEIVTAVEELLREGAPHGVVKLGFTPDEETGRGADFFDVAAFGADYAYTVDGGTLGELEYENFNAAEAVVLLHGFSIHPGEAKGRMKNAVLMALELGALLPPDETPARTEGYEGFFHLHKLAGDVENVRMRILIRDHDREKFEGRKALLTRAVDTINRRYGAGAAELRLQDTYYNMKEMILPHGEIIQAARRAMEKNGVTPRVCPIRGGTDGARLSFMGLPCPNLPTGGENAHGPYEYIPTEDMESMVAVLKTLITDVVG